MCQDIICLGNLDFPEGEFPSKMLPFGGPGRVRSLKFDQICALATQK